MEDMPNAKSFKELVKPPFYPKPILTRSKINLALEVRLPQIMKEQKVEIGIDSENTKKKKPF